jgi:hypothetical protein
MWGRPSGRLSLISQSKEEKMSLTKSESARINGAKSRGPKTARGRAFSSQNAVSHGLTARTLVLTNEKLDEFQELLNSFVDFLQPCNPVEVDLVSDMVSARWRLRRICSYQSALLDLEMDTQAPEFEKKFEEFDEETRGAVAFSAVADHSKGLALAHRMEVHLDRTYLRALETFRRLRGGTLPELSESPNEPKKSFQIIVGPASPRCSRPSAEPPEPVAYVPIAPEHEADPPKQKAAEHPAPPPVSDLAEERRAQEAAELERAHRMKAEVIHRLNLRPGVYGLGLGLRNEPEKSLQINEEISKEPTDPTGGPDPGKA